MPNKALQTFINRAAFVLRTAPRLFEAVSHAKKLSFILPLLALFLVSCDRNSTPSSLPANINLTASEGVIPKVLQGRYSLIPVNSGTAYSALYDLDSQTGRVWRETIDSEHQAIVFVSAIYKNVNGAISTVPNEATTDVIFKTKLRTPTAEEADEIKGMGIDPSKVVVGGK